MPLTVQSLSVAIICDGEELEAYGVKQEDRNSITAFVASEVGKVSIPLDDPLSEHEEPTIVIRFSR